VLFLFSGRCPSWIGTCRTENVYNWFRSVGTFLFEFFLVNAYEILLAYFWRTEHKSDYHLLKKWKVNNLLIVASAKKNLKEKLVFYHKEHFKLLWNRNKLKDWSPLLIRESTTLHVWEKEVRLVNVEPCNTTAW